MNVAPGISQFANVDYETLLYGSGVSIQGDAQVGRNVTIGDRVIIGRGAHVGRDSYIANDVLIGQFARIDEEALLMEGARVCPDYVESGSSNARQILDKVSVGPGVLLHNEVELGYGAIIPTQQTIAAIGHFGSKNRVVTIYGSDRGPRYSVGCQIGIDFVTLVDRVSYRECTDAESASTYEPYLNTFHNIGNIVQKAYNAEDTLVDQIKAMRRQHIPSIG